jgi:two-component system, OmpR family, response regulator ChvI
MRNTTTQSNTDVSSNSSSSTQSATTRKKDPSSYTILVVDDEPDTTLVYKLALEEAGFKVDVFNDPLAALSKLKEIYSHFPNMQPTTAATTKPYDLLLFDIRMPKMDGFELYRETKKIVKNQEDIKICFITAYEVYYEQLKQEFPKIDVGCYIKKPVNASDLIKRIKQELSLE